jgi:hypothetical protein
MLARLAEDGLLDPEARQYADRGLRAPDERFDCELLVALVLLRGVPVLAARTSAR